MKLTTAFKKIAALDHKIKCIQGSQGASKTFSVCQKWILEALYSDVYPHHCSIVTDTFPNLRTGAIKDFKRILEQEHVRYTSIKNPMEIKVNGWTFEFFSVDKENKGLGARRDRLFINECNRIPWDTARQLIARTHKEVILDYNPSRRFWAHEQYVETGDCDFLKLTYKDNEYLPQSEIDSIERHAPWGISPDESYWRVYGLGETGFVKGAIFKDFKKYKSIPAAKLVRKIGIDFGWEHPLASVLVSVDKVNKRIYWEELFCASHASYRSDLIPALKRRFKERIPSAIADSAAPRDIMALRKLGLSVVGCDKTGGVQGDIRTIKQWELFIHEDSKNLILELENLKWQIRNGNVLDVPVKENDDLFDAARYATIVILNFI